MNTKELLESLESIEYSTPNERWRFEPHITAAMNTIKEWDHALKVNHLSVVNGVLMRGNKTFNQHIDAIHRDGFLQGLGG